MVLEMKNIYATRYTGLHTHGDMNYPHDYTKTQSI